MDWPARKKPAAFDGADTTALLGLSDVMEPITERRRRMFPLRTLCTEMASFETTGSDCWNKPNDNALSARTSIFIENLQAAESNYPTTHNSLNPSFVLDTVVFGMG